MRVRGRGPLVTATSRQPSVTLHKHCLKPEARLPRVTGAPAVRTSASRPAQAGGAAQQHSRGHFLHESLLVTEEGDGAAPTDAGRRAELEPRLSCRPRLLCEASHG